MDRFSLTGKAVLPDGIKHALDAVSFTALLGSLVSVLPNIATLLTIIWTVMRMYETALSLRQKRAKGKDECSDD